MGRLFWILWWPPVITGSLEIEQEGDREDQRGTAEKDLAKAGRGRGHKPSKGHGLQESKGQEAGSPRSLQGEPALGHLDFRSV